MTLRSPSAALDLRQQTHPDSDGPRSRYASLKQIRLCGFCYYRSLSQRSRRQGEQWGLGQEEMSLAFPRSNLSGKGRKEKSSSSVMDPELWGNLQHHNVLENVYSKLPLREFYRLRGICKDWDRLARQRRCLIDFIRKPFFVIAYRAGPLALDFYCTGILTFHIASGRWKWNRLPIQSPHYNIVGLSIYTTLWQPFSVKGLLLKFRSGSPASFQVYNVHNIKKCIGGKISLPRRSLTYETPTGVIRCYPELGMAVDTFVRPYTFKIIFGGLNIRTKIYDSATGKWTEMRSFVMLTAPSKRWTIKSCLNCGGHVYIWSQMRTILVYSLLEDLWSTLNLPPQLHENDTVAGALGYWDGKVFIVMPDDGFALSVWELVNRAEQVWRKVECIPAEMYSWLVPQGDHFTKVFVNFCDELVLIYTVLVTNACEKVVLFNLATKLWEKNDNIDRSLAVVPLACDWTQGPCC